MNRIMAAMLNGGVEGWIALLGALYFAARILAWLAHGAPVGP